jgi:hypothetical protein
MSAVRKPRVYVYTEPQFAAKPWTGDRQGSGLLKIGYTSTGDSEKRIRQQFRTAKPGETPFSILYDTEALTDAGVEFMDHGVHNWLVRDGVRRIFTDEGGRTEWFECTVDEVKHAIAEIKAGRSFERQRHETYAMRPEQIAAVEKAAAYYLANPRQGEDGPAPKFLWNAKMRFGKTFATFQLAQFMGWKRLLILTYKPAVAAEWERELMTHVDFEGWQFVHRDGLQLEEADPERPICVFASLQDILGTEEKNGRRVGKARFAEARKIDWDCIGLDEYHFGAHRDGAKILYERESVDGSYAPLAEDLEMAREEAAIPDLDELPLRRKHLLFLSGTPFRALSSGEFLEDQIYTWSYADEQRAKAAWRPENGPNPYRMLPEMTLATYELSPALRAIAEKGETNEFSLNELFRAEWPRGENGTPDRSGQPTFVHEAEVQHFLEFISGRHMTEVFTEDGRKIEIHAPLVASSGADHTLWFLPDVPACKAMGELLRRKSSTALFGDVTVVIAAGNEAGMGAKAKEPVVEAIASRKTRRTFTLSCMKLTTGVTVPQWSAVLIMRDITSPETYFQTAFRAQSPWTEKDPHGEGGIRVLKENCIVYDFSPQRAVNLVFEYCASNNREGRKIEHVLEEFVGLLPIYAYAGGVSERLSADKVWEYAAVGVGATMLAKRWQSTQLVRVDDQTLSKVLNYPELVKALDGLEQFRSLKSSVRDQMQKIISAEQALKKPRSEGREPTREESVLDKANRKAKQDLREKLVKFLTRVPHFMYLTDFREEALRDVIRELDSELFERVTGMRVADFDQLAQLGLFNSALINQAILAFRRFEEGSLNYVGGGRIIKRIGAFDTSVTPEERDESLGIPSRVKYAIKPIAPDRTGRSVREVLATIFKAGVFAFSPKEQLLWRYADGTKLCIYEKGSGVIAWLELAGGVAQGSRARQILADPDLFPLEAPVKDFGWVEPTVVIDDDMRSNLDWMSGKVDEQWGYMVLGSSIITEHDFRLLTGQSESGADKKAA